jgi:toxin ParE1/3/4
MTLQWSPQAIDDLILLRHHISTDDPAAAKRVALHILHCVEQLLLEDPQLGHPGRAPGTRELIIRKRPFDPPP